MGELKPCPFCGGKAELKRLYPEIKFVPFPDGMGGFAKEPAMFYEWIVSCCNCESMGLPFEDRIYRDLESGEIVLQNDGRQKAIDSWNRRADDGAL